jgi:PAS domain S-box-containing protein
VSTLPVETSSGLRPGGATAAALGSSYAALLDALPDAVISADEAGLITDFNGAAERMFGYLAEDVLGKPLAMLMPERLRAAHRHGFARLLRGGPSRLIGASTELAALRSSGVEFPVQLSLCRWQAGGKTSFTAVVRDISERRLQETRARLATIVESSEDAIIGQDLDGAITSWNRGAQQLYGYHADEVVGHPISILLPPERADELTRIMERVRLGERVERYETERVDKDGRRIHVSLTTSPIADAAGRITGAATIARDVSESRRTEEELRRSNEELEQFAYVASHDLSEPLRVIAGFVDLLARRYQGKLDADADRFIGFTVAGVERMQAIIDDLLAYSRAGRTALELVEVDTAVLIREVLQALAPSIAEHRASVEVGGLPRVWGEPTLLRQLFQNLIANAVKFADSERARVRISAVREHERWRFDVADNGSGIDPRHAKRIFEMFQRMHGREVPGTGIGLSIAKRIAERHGGRIWVVPAAGGGSVFRVTIPDHVAHIHERGTHMSPGTGVGAGTSTPPRTGVGPERT